MDCLDETTVALFVERRLTGAEAGDVVRHMDGCDACRQLVAELGRGASDAATGAFAGSATAPAEPDEPALPIGERVGRYVVVGALGRGAMGAVYSAFDPDLDRKVAVKLLRRGAAATDDARARLLREAQALAKVSHPSVIAVHDVGTHAGQTFVAMELVVGGGTLNSWLRERRRSWRDVVAVMAQAGRGLAAAHATGLVHRDVKPDNILVDADGRVRIGDFGLALAADERAIEGSGSGNGRSSDPVIRAASKSVLDQSLTATGTVVGTPAYMAPEQLSGQVVTATTDQFSFCATLYEALYGVRPYPGTSLDGIAAAMRAGRIADPPADRGVPGWVRAAVVRGLRIDPARRHVSMELLVAALTREPWYQRPWLVVGAVVVAGATTAGAVWVGRAGADDDVCTGGDAEITAVWDAPRRAAIDRAFAASKVSYATDQATRVRDALDGYAAGWARAHRRVCEDTRVRRLHDDVVLALRMDCLTARRRQLGAVVELMTSADAGVVESAVDAVRSLERLDQCDDIAALRQIVRPPADPTTRAQVDTVNAELDRIEAVHAAGQADTAMLSRAGEIATRAEALGHAPLHARALFWHGMMLEDVIADRPAAALAFRAAINAADRARDDRLRFKSWARLVVVSDDDAEAVVPQAEAALARVGPDLELEIHWLTAQGALLHRLGKPREAADKFMEIVRRREQVEGPDSSGTGDSLLAAGVAMLEYAEPDDCVATIRRAIAVHSRAYGDRHPKTATTQGYLAVVLVALGRFAEAVPVLQTTIEITVAAFGEDDARVADFVLVLGTTYMMMSRYDEAAQAMDRAYTIRERMFGAGSLQLAEAVQQQGLLAGERGDDARAVELHRAALEVFTAKLSADDPFIAASQVGLGSALHNEGKSAAALPEAERGLAILVKAYGEDSTELAEALTLLGAIHVQLGRVAAAVTELERALALRDKPSPGSAVTPDELAVTQLELARAYTKTGRKDRARELLDQAIATFEQLDDEARLTSARELRTGIDR